MMDERTFWIGAISNGLGNKFCVCGEPLDNERNRELGVHISDGTGLPRLMCSSCGSTYAPHLQSLVRPAISAMKSHWAQIPSRYVLFDAKDYEPIEMPLDDLPEIPAEVLGDYSYPV